MSIFDQIDKAHQAYIDRHKRDEKLVDDQCTCLQCREGLTHIEPCEKE